MVSPVLRERRHSFGFVISEQPASFSRDQVTLLKQTPPGAPSASSLTPGSSGTMPTQTVYVVTTYVGAFGETLASAEGSASVTGSTGSLSVASPSAVSGATGYNVYASTASGAEVLQTLTPTAIGTATVLTTVATNALFPPSVPPAVILPAGLVLGATTVGTSAAYLANGGNTGNFTCGSVTVGAGTVQGIYNVEFIAATIYNVYYPNGQLVAEGHTGVAFSGGGLGFTITAGGTPAAAGDGATITVAANANVGLYAPLSLTAADGTQTPVAILANETNASGGNVKATVFTRTCEVTGAELLYPASATAAQITTIQAQLTALGIVVR